MSTLRSGLRRAPAVAWFAGALVMIGVVTGCDEDPSEDFTAPNEIEVEVASEFDKGKQVAASGGCLACHRIGDSGQEGPGMDLTAIGDQQSSTEIRQALMKGPGIMPSYLALKPDQLDSLVAFLSALKQP